MSKPLTIVARIQAKKDAVALVKAELSKLIEPTRKEQGCLQYDLHQDNEDPSIFLFFENWESRALWQVHMENDTIRAYREATEGAVENFSLHEMSRVD